MDRLEHKGVNNRILRKLGWVVGTSTVCRENPRNSELKLRPKMELLALRTELLSLMDSPGAFIARIFHSQDEIWVERCSAILDIVH
jgi:hypothetical protein